ncbi:hypothetical protein ADU37_CDS14510 [Thermococcus sp. 2319x1]|nr:hypothetical protein ADU37_CDS14510 [Thermococcus sp. 2319x1]
MRKRDILLFYFLYIILFNLMISTNSLILENSFERHPYYIQTIPNLLMQFLFIAGILHNKPPAGDILDVI